MNLGFQKLDYLYKEISDVEGKVYVKPLEKGYARTLGNSLRRVLMSSIPGTSIVGLKIDGVNHEFQMIEGTANDGTEIIANVKNMKFSLETTEVVPLRFSAKKAGTYYAKDIVLPEGVKCLTPDEELVKLTGEKEVSMTFYLTRGKGYIEAKDHDYLVDLDEDTIALDGTFESVYGPKIEVEPIRVGHSTNYEQLIMTIKTDGTISPDKAFILASEIVRTHLSFAEDMKEYIEEYELIKAEKEKEKEILDMSIDELKLSVRPLKCLKKAKCYTLRDVLALSRKQLSEIEQLGEKSIQEIERKVEALGYRIREE